MTPHESLSGELRPDHTPFLDIVRADAQRRLAAMSQTRTISAREFRLHKVESIPCLVEPILQQVGLACLAGTSDTGKSSFLRQLAIAVTTGEQDFLGFPMHVRHRSVIYVSTEDSQQATHFMIHRQTQRYQADEVAGLRFLFDYEDIIPTLYDELQTAPTDLVIIDCFSDVFIGDLKDTQRIRSFLSPYQKLAEDHQLLVLFLHHTGKRTEALAPSKNNLLGGQGFEAKMRLVLELRTDLMNTQNRHLCVVKGNYLSTRHKKESYVLRFDEQHFLFSNTNERTPFELLVKQPDADDSRAKYDRVKELKAQGMSYAQIAKEMDYASKNSVTQLLEKAKRLGWESGSVEEDKEE